MMTKKIYVITLTFILLFGWLLYFPATKGDYIWDDYSLTFKDPYVKQSLTVGNILHLFSVEYWTKSYPGRNGQYRPIRAISFLIEHSIYGFNSLHAHHINLALHICCSLGVAILSLILFKSRKASLIAALIFVLHPVHVETVVWIKNRAELFAGLFSLVTLILFIHAVRRKSIMFHGLCLLFFLAALMSKETALTLVMILGAYMFLADPE